MIWRAVRIRVLQLMSSHQFATAIAPERCCCVSRPPMGETSRISMEPRSRPAPQGGPVWPGEIGRTVTSWVDPADYR